MDLIQMAAEKVMGWKFHESGAFRWTKEGKGWVGHDSWDPTRDLKDANDLAGQMGEDGWYLQMDRHPSGKARATFHRSMKVYTARRDSLPEAITVAALMAIGAVYVAGNSLPWGVELREKQGKPATTDSL